MTFIKSGLPPLILLSLFSSFLHAFNSDSCKWFLIMSLRFKACSCADFLRFKKIRTCPFLFSVLFTNFLIVEFLF